MGRRAAMATTHVASRILGRMPYHGDWVLFLPVGDPRSLRKMVTFVITHYGSHRAEIFYRRLISSGEYIHSLAMQFAMYKISGVKTIRINSART